jgi:hypothetical protein
MKFSGLALFALGASTTVAYVVPDNTMGGSIDARRPGSGSGLAAAAMLNARHRKYQ